MTTTIRPLGSRAACFLSYLIGPLVVAGAAIASDDSAVDARRAAFFHGTIGTELVPLPVLTALPALYPQHFQPLGAEAGDWIDQFGFLRADPPREDGLPIGFTVSNHLPRTGAPAPVPFVGLGCATCHTTRIRRSIDDPGVLVVGPGNASLNLFAWIDAFQAAMREPELDAARIAGSIERTTGNRLTEAESRFIGAWAQAFRDALERNASKYDDPFGHAQSLDPAAVPTGPVRTQPFRTLVRSTLDRPGTTMRVFTKIAPVYMQELQQWAQVDGGVRDLKARSALAALAAGATVENLALPDIAENIVNSTDYTRRLVGPSYIEVFPDLADALDPDRIERGRRSYLRHCNYCHGHPSGAEGGVWVAGARMGEIVPYQEIGTDPERVTFRHFEELPDKLFELFPPDHPFRFPREDLRPGPLGRRRGYINKPISSAFSRAPYLHNASVLTLAELINLKPRRSIFFRGRNLYDPNDVGLASPEAPDRRHYFRFDTAAPGNSNRGHDFPWPYRATGWDEAELKDLLEYLKTI